MLMKVAGPFVPWSASACMVTMKATGAESAEMPHVRLEIIV